MNFGEPWGAGLAFPQDSSSGWNCTGNGSCGWSAGAEQGQVFPKPRRAVPMAGVDPGPRESPSHQAGGSDQGFGLRHRVWQVPLCAPLAHTWMSLSLPCSLPRSFLHPKMPPLSELLGQGELHLPGFCLEHTFPAFAWSTHSKCFFSASTR